MEDNGRSRLRLPLLLDGATGTEFMKAGMPAGVCVEQWALEHPETVASVARGYADAGSDVVYAPTFLANAGNLRMYGLSEQVAELNAALVRTVREALAGRGTLVAGDMSTTGLMCEPFGETEFVHLIGIYAEQAQALADELPLRMPRGRACRTADGSSALFDDDGRRRGANDVGGRRARRAGRASGFGAVGLRAQLLGGA